MTSIVSLSPAADAVVSGRNTHVRVTLGGTAAEPILKEQVTVIVSAMAIVVDGAVAEDYVGVVEEQPSFHGVDISILVEGLAENARHSIIVSVAGEVVSDTDFIVPIISGPYIAAITPVIGANDQAQSPVIVIDIAPASGVGSVQEAMPESSATDGALVASELTVPSLTFHDGHLGRRVDIGGVGVFIAEVVGDHVVMVTTGAAPGSNLAVTLYRASGLDVSVSDGVRPLRSGIPQTGTGWTAVLGGEPESGWKRVTLTRIGAPFAVGKIVDVGVRACDSDGRESILTSFFYVGDQKPPIVKGVSPAPGSVALATNSAPVFDVVDVGGGVATFDVTVNAVDAIVNKVPAVGVYSTSVVTPITGGFRVTLNRATAWPQGTAMITVTATDSDGNVMPPRSWTLHFGASGSQTTQTQGNGKLVDNDVVRCLAFDFTGTSFADPVALAHTGYAADGFWYDRGVIDISDRASWASETAGSDRSATDNMPTSGSLIASATGWSIVDSGGAMWMRCLTPLGGAAWAMAGTGQPIDDANMVKDAPAFALVSGPSITMVDFAIDGARHIDANGLQVSATKIAQRRVDASTTADSRWSMIDSAVAYSSVCFWRSGNGSWMVAAARNEDIEFAWDMSDVDIMAITAIKDRPLNRGRKTAVLGVVDAGAWHQMQATGFPHTSIIACNEDGVVACDWALTLGALDGIKDHMPMDDAKSVDVVISKTGEVLAFAAQALKATLLNVSDVSALAVVGEWTTAAMGVSGQLQAGACDPACELDAGYVYVANATAVMRWRHQRPTATAGGRLTTMFADDGVRSLAIAGRTSVYGRRLVNMSAVITDEAPLEG